jgi:hypothetical protein
MKLSDIFQYPDSISSTAEVKQYLLTESLDLKENILFWIEALTKRVLAVFELNLKTNETQSVGGTGFQPTNFNR